MKSYLSLIPLYAKVHKRQNRMTVLCIIFSVFMVTSVFSLAEMCARMEQTRLVEKHGNISYGDLFNSTTGQTLLLTSVILFLLILTAGVLMISSSLNSTVAQRIKFFGMMRCIGMSKKQIIHFVTLEALNWCKTAIPVGVILGIIVTWVMCIVLRFLVGEEFSNIPLFGISFIGIASGILVGIITVLLAARAPAKRAAKVSPVSAVSGNFELKNRKSHKVTPGVLKVETVLGIDHAIAVKKNIILMTGSFALSIILFLICDDDIQTTGQIERLIQKIAKRNFVDTDIEVFWNGESLVNTVAAGDSFDIIYLDIEMDKEDGISAAKRIRIYDKNVLIIYVTSHENHMKESFVVRPFQFLVKPVSEKQMETCFMAAYEDINRGDFYFRYSYQRMNHKVLIRDILYFESNKRKVFIVMEENTFELYGKLNDIENSLKACKVSFLRVHQSFLVNYKHIKGQSYDFVLMDNGKKISISEDRRKMISEQYCSMEDTFYVDN